MQSLVIRLVTYAVAIWALAFSALARADFDAGMKALDKKDYERARLELEQAVEAGHVVARSVLFTIYRDGYGVQRNPKRAYELYLPLAEKGDSSAMVEIGDLAVNGAFESDGESIARSWYEKAVAKGNIAGYCGLANLAAPTSNRPGDSKERVRLLQIAANDQKLSGTKCPNQARKHLADAYATGNGVPMSACLSVKYRGDLVAYGGGEGNWAGAEQRRRNPEIQSIVLAMIVAQYNRPEARNVGKEAFVKTVLSDYDEPFRNLLMAVLMKHGLGVPRDIAASRRLYSEAVAKMEDVPAFENMSIRQWARWFYEFDFGCLRLTR